MTLSGAPYCIVSGDFARTGGMDRANHALADFLATHGAPVHLVAHHVDSELLRHSNITFHRVPRPLGAHLLGAPLLDHAGRRVAKMVRATGGRVVVNGGNCAFGDVNWVHYLHAAYSPELRGSALRQLRWKLQHRLYVAQERRSLRSAALVITNSHRTRADVIEQIGVDPSRVRTVHLGLDCGKFAPFTVEQRRRARSLAGWPIERPVVAFVGALGDRRKGFDTVFDAWTALSIDPAWDARLIVIGAGAELESWKARAASARLTNMEFLGFRNDVAELLRMSDAFVAPTRYEAYGLGIAEAVCCGLPAFVSRDAGVAELCPASARPRLLIDRPNDPAVLADRLRQWREDVSGYRSVSNEWANAIRLRTWSLMAEQMVEVIQSGGRSPIDQGCLVLPGGAGISSRVN